MLINTKYYLLVMVSHRYNIWVFTNAKMVCGPHFGHAYYCLIYIIILFFCFSLEQVVNCIFYSGISINCSRQWKLLIFPLSSRDKNSLKLGLYMQMRIQNVMKQVVGIIWGQQLMYGNCSKKQDCFPKK